MQVLIVVPVVTERWRWQDACAPACDQLLDRATVGRAEPVPFLSIPPFSELQDRGGCHVSAGLCLVAMAMGDVL